MRLEYADIKETKLRLAEIQAILKNEIDPDYTVSELEKERDILENILRREGFDPFGTGEDDMTRNGIFNTIRDRLNEHILSGETDRWEEINASVKLLQPYPFDHVLTVWCEVRDDGTRHYSVYVEYEDGADDGNPVRWREETYDTCEPELRSAIDRALDKFQTIKWSDPDILEAWAVLEDVPMNPKTECNEAEFLWFPVGTPASEIWGWFAQNYSRGVRALMYPGEDPIPMDACDMRIALTALVESFVETQKEHGVTQNEITCALSGIFKPGNLCWLGLGELEATEDD